MLPSINHANYTAGYDAGVKAERERCAKIADHFKRDNVIQDTIGEAQNITADTIARIIRLG